jgi:hypothetical protein
MYHTKEDILMSCRCSALAVLFLFLTVSAWAGIQDGLVGYWPMDSGSGNTVADASGNGNDGTAQNTNWVDGKYGKALEFDGTTSIVDIPYVPDMTPSEGATIAAWVFPTDTSRSCIVGQFEGYGMALFTGLQLKSVIWGDDWVMDDVTIPANEWSYIAMTWDISNAERMVFLNGDLVGERGGALPVPSVQNNFGIGVWVGWPVDWGDDWFMGIIDDVRLWNRALEASEVGQASQPAAVDPQEKAATAWGLIKAHL